MNTVIRNVAAVVAGLILGSMVNMALIIVGPHVIPPPAGADMTTMEGLKASMHLLEPRHFIFPYLAHALGVLSGGLLASLLAASHRMKFAVGIGAFFLIGGVVNAFMLPAPLWFIVLDLVGAYLPIGRLAGILGEKVRPSKNQDTVAASPST